MAAPKGHPRYGGRKKGTPNKESIPLGEIAASLGCHPFEILCRFAMGDWEGLKFESKFEIKYSNGVPFDVERITSQMRFNAAAEAAQYLYPKRKAIETDLTVNLSEDKCAQFTDEQVLKVSKIITAAT